MIRLTPLISALAVKNLLHLVAIVWVSLIVLLGLFVRPGVIKAVGAHYWLASVLPLFVLLYIVWISFIVMMLRDAQLFTAGTPPRVRRPADRARKTG